MKRAKAGRPRMAWYRDFQSTTSKSNVSFQKLVGPPKTTCKLIFPRGYTAFPGTIPWKVVPEDLSAELWMSISSRVLVKMMLIPLPLVLHIFLFCIVWEVTEINRSSYDQDKASEPN